MAAYTHGEEWYQALLVYLKENLDYLDPHISMTRRIFGMDFTRGMRLN